MLFFYRLFVAETFVTIRSLNKIPVHPRIGKLTRAPVDHRPSDECLFFFWQVKRAEEIVRRNSYTYIHRPPYSESSFSDKSASESGRNRETRKPLLEALLSLKEDSEYGAIYVCSWTKTFTSDPFQVFDIPL